MYFKSLTGKTVMIDITNYDTTRTLMAKLAKLFPNVEAIVLNGKDLPIEDKHFIQTYKNYITNGIFFRERSIISPPLEEPETKIEFESDAGSGFVSLLDFSDMITFPDVEKFQSPLTIPEIYPVDFLSDISQPASSEESKKQQILNLLKKREIIDAEIKDLIMML